MIEQLVFLLLAAIALAGATMMVLMRNPVHSALFLVISFFNVAGIFVLLGAEFLAAVQVIVYTGAIMVLFVFVIMLLQLRTMPRLVDTRGVQAWLAPVLVLVFLAEAALVVASGVMLGQKGIYTPEYVLALGGNPKALGGVLYTVYLFPFEAASLILLMAAIGAIMLARKELLPPERKLCEPISYGLEPAPGSAQERELEKVYAAEEEREEVLR